MVARALLHLHTAQPEVFARVRAGIVALKEMSRSSGLRSVLGIEIEKAVLESYDVKIASFVPSAPPGASDLQRLLAAPEELQGLTWSEHGTIVGYVDECLTRVKALLQDESRWERLLALWDSLE